MVWDSQVVLKRWVFAPAPICVEGVNFLQEKSFLPLDSCVRPTSCVYLC